ncbi:serine/threonine protein kinase, partial [Bacillus licheniformis]
MARRVAGRAPVLAGLTYVRPLGSGGFADVFCYEQDLPRRVVAV